MLHLYSNKLSGPLPPELGKLSRLVELRLWDNQLTGSLPEGYSQLSKLKVLHLASNQLTGQISPGFLMGMTSLEYIFLNDNKLSGEVPVSSLAALPEIKSIYLSNNAFDDVEMASNQLLQACKSTRVPQLEEIDIFCLLTPSLAYRLKRPVGGASALRRPPGPCATAPRLQYPQAR